MDPRHTTGPHRFRMDCKELCGAAWPAPRKQHDFFELQGARAGCVPHPSNTGQKVNSWTRRLNGLAKTHVDRPGPANIAPRTRKISYLTRGSKRDPSKTAFTWNRLCFPEVSGAQRPKQAFAGASFGGSRSMVKPAPRLDVPPQ